MLWLHFLISTLKNELVQNFVNLIIKIVFYSSRFIFQPTDQEVNPKQCFGFTSWSVHWKMNLQLLTMHFTLWCPMYNNDFFPFTLSFCCAKTCADGSSGHGTCGDNTQPATCHCIEGWTGTQCNQKDSKNYIWLILDAALFVFIFVTYPQESITEITRRYKIYTLIRDHLRKRRNEEYIRLESNKKIVKSPRSSTSINSQEDEVLIVAEIDGML